MMDAEQRAAAFRNIFADKMRYNTGEPFAFTSPTDKAIALASIFEHATGYVRILTHDLDHTLSCDSRVKVEELIKRFVRHTHNKLEIITHERPDYNWEAHDLVGSLREFMIDAYEPRFLFRTVAASRTGTYPDDFVLVDTYGYLMQKAGVQPMLVRFKDDAARATVRDLDAVFDALRITSTQIILPPPSRQFRAFRVSHRQPNSRP